MLKEYGDVEKISEMLKTVDKEAYKEEYQKKLDENKITYMDTSENKYTKEDQLNIIQDKFNEQVVTQVAEMLTR